MLKNTDNTIRLAERLNQVSFVVPEYSQLLAMLQRQHESVAVRIDEAQPWGANNRHPVRGIIVTGQHYSGKTDLVAQCLEAVEPVESVDGQAIEPNSRMIEAPNVFTQSSMARAILAVMGYPLTRKMTTDLAWSKVSDRLDKAAVTQLAIDNWQWSFSPSRAGKFSRDVEKRQIQAAFCNMLDHSVWPLPLVLIGLPEVMSELAMEGMHHIKDRCDVINIGRMRNDAGEYASLLDGIGKLCQTAGLQLQLHMDDLPMQRLAHAADDARGVAITIAKLAVLQAVRNGSSRLEIEHFGAVYASTASSHDDQRNPFVSDTWATVDTSGIGSNPDVLQALVEMNGPKKASPRQ
ncbi:TniB family NTP-binding protein [Devosia sp.]|uniref:TniB family NTP-binding protein n=1 Tax=Devosia sp. TaxID=1871048 RepID=UPI0027329561|nr:TniB family NTP-binding protein [Devosia sp.]MDP2781334.1 TniB family NTP-binding protein [Devosia sp.]